MVYKTNWNEEVKDYLVCSFIFIQKIQVNVFSNMHKILLNDA